MSAQNMVLALSRGWEQVAAQFQADIWTGQHPEGQERPSLLVALKSKTPSPEVPASLADLPLPHWPEMCPTRRSAPSGQEVAFSLGPTPGTRVRVVSPKVLGQGLQGVDTCM